MYDSPPLKGTPVCLLLLWTDADCFENIGIVLVSGFVLPSAPLTLSSAFAVGVHLSRTQIKLTTNPNSPPVYSFRRASLTCARSVLICCSSISKTKGTKARCGGAWAPLCSAFCLTGASSLEEEERGGGEGRVEGSPPLLSSSPEERDS